MNNKDNEKLKRTLLHYINLEYYANGLDEEFQTLLAELQERCTKAIESQKSISTKSGYTLLYKVIKEEVDKFQKELKERLEEQAEIIMNEELEFLDNLYNEPSKEQETDADELSENTAVKTGLLALGGISLSKILFAPIDGRDTVAQFAERTGKNILRSYDTSLRSAYLFGQSSEDVTAQIDNKIKQVARGMQSGIRTAIPSFAKSTDRIVFLNNDVEVVYCAVLDGRTCIVCGSNHGLHYKSISVAPSIPVHANCRCTYIRASDVTEPMPTYEEFLESLSEDEQIHILGQNRYDLWKNYNISLEKFVNNGRKLRLDKIDLPANLIVTKTGGRSKIIDILSGDDVLKKLEVANNYYTKIRTGENKEFISRIAENSGKTYREIEQIVNHVFKQKHNLGDGVVDYFYPSEEIVKAFERLRTNEHTDTDILLLNHEFAELTYMKNKKYNLYEVAHEMANRKYNWEEVIRNANLSKD